LPGKRGLFTLKALDPFYRIFNHKSEYFDYNSNTDFTLSQIDKFSPKDKQGYLKFIKTTKAIFQKGFVELADKPFEKFSDMMKIVPDMLKLRSYKTVYQYTSRSLRTISAAVFLSSALVGGNPLIRHRSCPDTLS
jgi:phytoene desaturase